MFKPGDIVVAIAVDNFHPNDMPIGSEWIVVKHNVIRGNYRYDTVTLQSPDPSHRWSLGSHKCVTPYANKFALKSSFFLDPDFTLEELNTANQMISSLS